MKQDPGRRYADLRRMVHQRILDAVQRPGVPGLRQALQSVVAPGGKRIRAILALLSCEAVGGRVRDALDAAAAIELMHNFTLVHDDIMDHAPTRHGRPTVHTRWGLNHGILTGDVLIGLAYDCLSIEHHRRFAPVAKLLTKGLLDVCEGQAIDLQFGNRKKVVLSDYFRMIEKKTASLFLVSAMIGGIMGSGIERHMAALRKFGLHLGRAFQVQDDLLDVVAEARVFGKSPGGDIVEGKKTFLLLKACQRARGNDAALLRKVTSGDKQRNQDLVNSIFRVYARLGVIDAARNQIATETREATRALAKLPKNRGTLMLDWLSGMLLSRAA
jgi:geranylgeranyl diphosphate synthase type II